jgi:virulence factor Mce-like protein
MIIGAVGFALVCFLLIVFVWRSFGGTVPLEAEGYRVHILVSAEGSQLSQGSDVRIAGVKVGHVVDTRAQGDSLDAELEMDPEFAPIASDAKAIVRTKTLLGEGFVELAPGTAESARVPDGGSLPDTQVARAEQIDRVVGTFDEKTRAAFKSFLGGLGRSLDGRAQDFSNSIGNTAPTLADIRDVVAIMDDQKVALHQVLRDSATTFDAIASDEAGLREIMTAGDAFLDTTAERNREITASIKAFPPLLTELRATLAEGERAAADAAPTLRAIRPVAPRIRPALTRASKLAPDVEAAFHELLPLIDAARSGITAGTEMVGAVGSLVETMYPAGRELVPVLRYVSLFRREAAAALANGSSATQGAARQFDGSLLHYVRGVPVITPEQAYGYPHRLASDRYNPYIRPGGINDLLTRRGYRSFDCDHVTPDGGYFAFLGSSPPCRAPTLWKFDGEYRSYPHVQALPDTVGKEK